jgi:deoxyribodipyrimidine photolyase-related protein
MWTGEPTLYHSSLSGSLNLKLLNPRECCERAIQAYRDGKAPLQSVEAFVRQIIGWREFVRGVYWLEGPTYADRNGLDQHGNLPDFYWTAETDMACMRTCIGQVVTSGFGHHIQRLMVMGNFALIGGVHPRAVSDWYLGMFVDGIDWVTLPNALGMVMHADQRPGAARGVTGLVGTKPYAASGKYIERMSNYCTGCRYDPAKRSGPCACPFTVLYWDFLIRTREKLAPNQRMAMILKNVDRMATEARTQITIDADLLRTKFGISNVERG